MQNGAPLPHSPDGERERMMIEAVVTLAKALREERDRLAARLGQLEQEISALVAQVEAYQSGAASPSSRAEKD